jgi:hypothetical protein
MIELYIILLSIGIVIYSIIKKRVGYFFATIPLIIIIFLKYIGLFSLKENTILITIIIGSILSIWFSILWAGKDDKKDFD